jgi:hypothetical protein
MPDIFGGNIQDIFFFVLRLLAAVGGFLAGWVLGGPAAAVLGRLAFHRPMPPSARFVSKLGSGLLVGLLVFWYLVLGPGGGGGGRGGGTGAGVGPGKKGSGPAKVDGKGTGEDVGKGSLSPKTQKSSERLAIKLLGGAEVKDGKYYLIDKSSTALDAAALKSRLEEVRNKIAGVDIIVSDNSVGTDHPAYRYLLQLTLEYDLRPSIVQADKQK